MILQALNEYYDRSREAGKGLPDYGWETRLIDFALVINPQGQLVDIDDLRTQQGKRKIGRSVIAPRAVNRSSGVAANLLWDKVEYVLGYNADQERAKSQLIAFIQEIESKAPTSLDSVAAVLSFLKNKPLEQAEKNPRWTEVRENLGNITFRLDGERALIFEDDQLRTQLILHKDSENSGWCLVNGQQGEIARLHTKIGLLKSQKKGPLVAIDKGSPAFNSYGKTQGFNAPITSESEFKYSAALLHLVRQGSQQKLLTGDSTTVWWAAKPDHPVVNEVFALFGDVYAKADDPNNNSEKLLSVFTSPHSGAAPHAGDSTEFYVLALAPNAARISVRYWLNSTADEIGQHIHRWFNDLALVAPAFARTPPSLNQLLRSLSPQRKLENLPPNLAGEVMRAVLSGGQLPITLLQAALRRNRAEQTINYERAAVIKAVLQRNRLFKNQEDLTVSLDMTNTNTGYRLGRLFATFERLQEAANPGLNKTIADTYFGTAGSTPQSVFNRLFRLRTHHLAKLRREKPGQAVNLEKLIGEIVEGLDGETALPTTLRLGDQGQFAIGYYHQRQAFFTKTDTNETNTNDEK